MDFYGAAPALVCEVHSNVTLQEHQILKLKSSIVVERCLDWQADYKQHTRAKSL